jgi:nitroreductase
MDLYQAIHARRSIRKFSSTPIPDDALERMINAMRAAPSGKNAQPWRFIVVKEPETRKRISEICTFFTSSGREISQGWIADAPVIFVVCGNPAEAFVKFHQSDRVIIADLKYLEETQKEVHVDWESGLLIDLTIPMDHLTLAAVAEGLGGCWVAGLDEEKLKTLLGIPASWRAPAVMPVGYPLENPDPRRRKPMDEIVFKERFKE